MEVKPSGPSPARVLIVGEAPGREEVGRGLPFIGASGYLLDQLLAEAGIDRRQCRVTNVTMEQPVGNEIGLFFGSKKNSDGCSLLRGRYCKAPIIEGLKALTQEIISTNPDLILALGGTALWALTGNESIEKWRGSLLKCDIDSPCHRAVEPFGAVFTHPYRVLPTYHPAAVLRQWSWRYITQADIRKAAHILSGKVSDHLSSAIMWLEPTADKCLDWLADLKHKLDLGPVRISCDIETTARYISLVGLATTPGEALCIPLMTKGGSGRYFLPDEEFEVIMALREVLMHPNSRIVGQNFLYDAQYLIRQMLCWPTISEDSMLKQHLCFVEMPKDLAFLSSMYLIDHVYWKDELKNYRELPDDEIKFRLYNLKDVIATLRISNEQNKVVDKMGLRKQLDFQMQVTNILLQMMWRGTKVDLTNRKILSAELGTQIASSAEWFEFLVGRTVGVTSKGAKLWYNSPKQTAVLLYDEFKLPIQYAKGAAKKGKPKSRTTNDEALETLSKKTTLLYPVLSTLQKYRTLRVFKNTFVDMPLDSDQRVRCSFNPGGTVTYRLSSSKNAFGSGGNLQNIPRIPEKGTLEEANPAPNIRSLFVPDEGYILLDFDLPSADLRYVAWDSDDKELKSLIKSGEDVYTIIAREYYRDQSIVKKDPRRQIFKGVAHAIDYFAQAKALSANFGLLIIEAERIRKWYLQKFPGIDAWHKRTEYELKTTKRLTNIFGFQRIFLDRVDTILPEALAWKPQSAVGLTINMGLVNLHQRHPYFQPLLQVHDSLVGQIPEAKFDQIPTLIQDMTITLPFADPLILPPGCKWSAKSWGVAEDFKLV